MAMTLITTNTSSNAASSSFTSSIDSTYKLYVFKFIDLNPVTDDVLFQFQVNATDGADYNDSQITSTFFLSSHTESDSDASLSYVTGADQALGTAFQRLCKIGNGSDESAAGELFLFNPSSTTYVKNFYSRCVEYHAADTIQDTFVAGYINDATAIDDIQFKMSSGNMDGTIKMYGVG
jgi:hypothetical protein